MEVLKLAAFADGNRGGNPAGVVICKKMPEEKEMLSIAADVGYSETAFLTPRQEGWRIRYFSPEIEVPFCGHATIASGAVLGAREGEGHYRLILNDAEISVEVEKISEGDFAVTLVSPETWSKTAPGSYVDQILEVFHICTSQLNPDFPVRIAFAGAKHLILVLAEKSTLSAMNYDFEKAKDLMLKEDVGTVCLVWIESENILHARNAFAAGGVYEDPATGAAAAALAGYLRDIKWQGSRQFEILQGADMGCPSRLLVEFTGQSGAGIRVTGKTRKIE